MPRQKKEDYRVKCYGVKCRQCDAPCELQAAGISRFREEMDDRRVARTGTLHDADVSGTAFQGRPTSPGATPDRFDDNEIAPDREREIRLETVRKMAEMYFNRPASFDLAMRRAYFNGNQSDLARVKGMTRAAISKQICRERDEKLKSENSALRNMTETERTVYRLAAEYGILRVSEIARQAGYTRRTVYLCIQRLSEKYGISIHIYRPSQKKDTKKLTPPAKSGKTNDHHQRRGKSRGGWGCVIGENQYNGNSGI